MVKIKILKNGKLIKQFTCLKKNQQEYFERAHSIAGGMWNGKDEFKVVVE